ncbi:hypothetical protein SSAG_04867 [Streptomyces sp. Mg1]|nr:hypothetical protein SSAG_04867 [Streptomyces sp. Mg1]
MPRPCAAARRAPALAFALLALPAVGEGVFFFLFFLCRAAGANSPQVPHAQYPGTDTRLKRPERRAVACLRSSAGR